MNTELFNFNTCDFDKIGDCFGFPFFYLLDYYPLNKFPDLSTSLDGDRRFIWNFKDGGNINDTVGSFIFSIERNFNPKIIPQSVLSVIPASTQDKTSKRFKKFVNQVCLGLGCINGFNVIENDQDRYETKGSIEKDIISYLHFNTSLIKNRNVFLFDDVITTGQSFLQCAQYLKKEGAREVIGLFLGRTFNKNRTFKRYLKNIKNSTNGYAFRSTSRPFLIYDRCGLPVYLNSDDFMDDICGEEFYFRKYHVEYIIPPFFDSEDQSEIPPLYIPHLNE